MKLYKSDKVRFVVGLIIIFIIYSCYYIFIADNKDSAQIPRKLRHAISLGITIAVYVVGTIHLGKLKVTWMATLWHIVHIAGLCIITAIGIYDWIFLTGKPNLGLSMFARSIQELLISPVLYVGMGLLHNAFSKSLKNTSNE